MKRLKPELATVMGLSLMMDDGANWDDRPLRELGIEPRSASEYIAQTVGSQEPQQPIEGLLGALPAHTSGEGNMTSV